MRGEVAGDRGEAPGPVGQAEADEPGAAEAPGSRQREADEQAARARLASRDVATGRDKLLIGEALALDEGEDRVAEDVRVVLVRLEPAPLVDVRGEVLVAQVVVRAGDEPPVARARRRPARSSGWPRPRIAARIRWVVNQNVL